MSLSLTLSALDDGWADHLRTYQPYADAIGLDSSGAVRLYRGYPTALLAKPVKGDFPRTTFYVIDRARVSNDAPPHVIIVSDTWDWHDLARIDAVDEAMLQRVAGENGCVTWYDETRELWLSSSLEDASDPPDILPRRRRVWKVAPA